MGRTIFLILTALFFAVQTAGCGAADTVYIERTESGMADSTQDREDSEEDSGAGRSAPETTEEEEQICYVHVCGAVSLPGVYALEQGSRVYEALLLAGGLTEDASERSVNQAEPVCDGQMIYVPTEEEAAGAPDKGQAGEQDDGRVNLNTASLSELMSLPGIGQTKAESIIAYREQNGAFSSVEDIMQVEGIKDGLYARIKDDIKVK